MDTDVDGGVGRLLKDARRRAGLTQSELAGKAGVSLGTVRDLEQGRSSRPQARSMQALADALGLARHHRVELQQLAQRRPSGPAAPAGPLRISILGPLVATRSPEPGGSSEPVDIGTGRHRIVLARLALTPGRAVGREELIHLLWGDDAPPSAGNVLQTHMSRIRRLLQPHPHAGAPRMLALGPGGYRLHADEDQLDLVGYRARLAHGRSASVDPQREFEILSDALEMWRGDSAAEDVPELDCDPLVTALSDQRVDAAIRLARLAGVLRRPAPVPHLRRLAARHPWHEALHARLMVALAASGQQAAALEVYDGVRDRLAEELGLDPGVELREARQSVLKREWAPEAVTVHGGRRPRPWQTPAPPPDFTGRESHLGRVRQHLRETALCVVSGMAGAGKTSLALRAAQMMRPDFPDGQLYLNLRGADQKPVTVMDALARLLRALGIEGRAIPGDPDEAAALYRSELSDRRMLIVLDNAHNAAQVRPLRPGPGGCAVLVTSRNQCADLDGAALLDLPVLDLAEALALLGSRIGTARVQAERAGAEALIEACGRLPVALRVIAGRLAVRPQWRLRDLLERFADERSRLDQISIGDVAVLTSFELSYRELPAPQARVFREAALIPGEGFSAAAAAAMVVADERSTARTLDGLVAENLLQSTGTGRYRYHDLLRIYAATTAARELTAAEREAALGRLFDWCLARTVAAVRLVYSEMVRLPLDIDPDPAGFTDVDAALAWLDEEAGNLVAAIETAAEGVHRSRAWQLADQLRAYFFVRRDAVRWLAGGQAGLAAAEAADDHRARAAMHQNIGQALWSVGKHETASESYRRGVAAARRSGWRVGEAYLLHNLGLVRAELGHLDEAHELYQQALRIGTSTEFDHIRAVTLNDLGAMCHERGRLTEAVGYFQAALTINQGASRLPSAIANRGNLGMVLRQLEEFDTARAHLDVALQHHRTTGSATGQMSVLDELSQLYAQRSEWTPAVSAATEALRIARRLADRRSEAGVLNTLGFALLGTRAVTEARTQFAGALAVSREHGYRYFEAQACIGLAESMLLTGDHEQASARADEAVRIAGRRAYRILHGDALLALARAALAGQDRETAAEHCRAARAVHASTSGPGKVRACAALLTAIEGEPAGLSGH
jgi:DNA-binding SARP family transcriptional activator/tetratricopeptide (TPR) repeat protein/DNA-binding XRE family transcriptional regulator